MSEDVLMQARLSVSYVLTVTHTCLSHNTQQHLDTNFLKIIVLHSAFTISLKTGFCFIFNAFPASTKHSVRDMADSINLFTQLFHSMYYVPDTAVDTRYTVEKKRYYD